MYVMCIVLRSALAGSYIDCTLMHGVSDRNMFAGSLLADLATKGLFVTITTGIATHFVVCSWWSSYSLQPLLRISYRQPLSKRTGHKGPVCGLGDHPISLLESLTCIPNKKRNNT